MSRAVPADARVARPTRPRIGPAAPVRHPRHACSHLVAAVRAKITRPPNVRPYLIGELVVVLFLLKLYDLVREHADLRKGDAIQQRARPVRLREVAAHRHRAVDQPLDGRPSMRSTTWPATGTSTRTSPSRCSCWPGAGTGDPRPTGTFRNALVLINLAGLTVFLLLPGRAAAAAARRGSSTPTGWSASARTTSARSPPTPTAPSRRCTSPGRPGSSRSTYTLVRSDRLARVWVVYPFITRRGYRRHRQPLRPRRGGRGNPRARGTQGGPASMGPSSRGRRAPAAAVSSRPDEDRARHRLLLAPAGRHRAPGPRPGRGTSTPPGHEVEIITAVAERAGRRLTAIATHRRAPAAVRRGASRPARSTTPRGWPGGRGRARRQLRRRARAFLDLVADGRHDDAVRRPGRHPGRGHRPLAVERGTGRSSPSPTGSSAGTGCRSSGRRSARSPPSPVAKHAAHRRPRRARATPSRSAERGRPRRLADRSAAARPTSGSSSPASCGWRCASARTSTCRCCGAPARWCRPTSRLEAIIIGDGPRRAGLERYLAKHDMTDWVTLYGRATHEQIREVYRDADFFVAPATLESFGIAALEARSAGLPIIAHARFRGPRLRRRTAARACWPTATPTWPSRSPNSRCRPQLRDAMTALQPREHVPQFGWSEVLEQCQQLYERGRLPPGRRGRCRPGRPGRLARAIAR